ncbi:MAG: 4-(cytidine 5'-diphospho)-2-C-methyl-D-erythritol kinase, partial [Muribaculaceae bacterium]|nr:4-(cytidine 5'-diphospho)-2-C-methyl-D-erythritol kinase [Muribaculaceae bacterium]
PIANWSGKVKNDFEPGIFALHHVVGEIKQAMLDGGAIYSAMSGSGSAVFGLFNSEPEATAVKALFEKNHSFMGKL